MVRGIDVGEGFAVTDKISPLKTVPASKDVRGIPVQIRDALMDRTT